MKHIQNRNDFLALVALSRTQDTSNWTVYLDNDIQLGDDDMQTLSLIHISEPTRP